MKLVTAVIQPDSLDTVQKALVKYGVRGMTVSEVSGYARQRGHREVYRGETLTIDFILKVKLEILCDDDESEPIVAIITATARTGQVGDGKVWVTPVDEVVRVRTGEAGALAI
ncbi:MAG: P-II family nitrogen regulator [Propionibacteriaceae bacterium]|nr:P-II family nitrogen regulator [Propionibacteriaceae bacterium]